MIDTEPIVTNGGLLKALSNDYVVINYAQRQGCAPCNRLKPHLKLASERVDDIPFFTVYLDEGDSELLHTVTEAMAIMSTPTVVFYHRQDATTIEGRTAPLIIKEITDARGR